MAVASKGKGKSAGLRVVTFNVERIDVECVVIHLITIYDKQEVSNVSEKYINQVIKNLR